MFELAQMIRQHPRFHQTAIIFVLRHQSDRPGPAERVRTGRRRLHFRSGRPAAPAGESQRFRELQRQAKQTEELKRSVAADVGRIMTLQDEGTTPRCAGLARQSWTGPGRHQDDVRQIVKEHSAS